MAYLLKPLNWEKLFEHREEKSLVAELPRGRYVIDVYYDLNRGETTYRWGYSFDRKEFPDNGYFYCSSLEEAKENCERNWESRILEFMDEVVVYKHVVELTATGIDEAVENDTIVIEIDGVTYTFTADENGVFGDYDVTGTADEDLSFFINETEPSITIVNGKSTFTVSSNTITLGGEDSVYDEDKESVVTEL